MNEYISKLIALFIFITVISKFIYLMRLIMKDIIKSHQYKKEIIKILNEGEINNDQIDN